MALVRWNPFAELINMQDQVNRFFGDRYLKPSIGEREVSDEWSPSVDIYEDADGVVLKVELPEMEMKDIDVKIEDNTLTVRGERKLDKEDKKDNYHRIERYYGLFSRSFTLPSTVDQEKVKASYDRGVLRINLPKKEDTKPKKIKIDVT
ncbi:MAG: Hsp20/alpha crystallin family protein [Nitrospirae bacterium]|nr:Hsp20/alpha crystallin family protein [Nitrospirota bacterium]